MAASAGWWAPRAAATSRVLLLQCRDSGLSRAWLFFHGRTYGRADRAKGRAGAAAFPFRVSGRVTTRGGGRLPGAEKTPSPGGNRCGGRHHNKAIREDAKKNSPPAGRVQAGEGK